MKRQKIKVESIKTDHLSQVIEEFPKKVINSLKSSLHNYGQVIPITIDVDNKILNGIATLIAVKELGWEEIEVVKLSHTDEQFKEYKNQLNNIDLKAINQLLK